MEGTMLIRTIFEVLAVMFLLWGFLNEEKFVDFEDKLIAKFKKKFLSK